MQNKMIKKKKSKRNQTHYELLQLVGISHFELNESLHFKMQQETKSAFFFSSAKSFLRLMFEKKKLSNIHLQKKILSQKIAAFENFKAK